VGLQVVVFDTVDLPVWVSAGDGWAAEVLVVVAV